MHRFLRFIVILLIATHGTGVFADPVRWANEGWRTDFAKHAADLARIQSGGPPRDGIPSIDNPVFPANSGFP